MWNGIWLPHVTSGMDQQEPFSQIGFGSGNICGIGCNTPYFSAMESLCLPQWKRQKLNLVLQRLYLLGAPKANRSLFEAHSVVVFFHLLQASRE